MIGERPVPRDPASDLSDLGGPNSATQSASRGPPRIDEQQGSVRSRPRQACRGACEREGRTRTALEATRTRAQRQLGWLAPRSRRTLRAIVGSTGKTRARDHQRKGAGCPRAQRCRASGNGSCHLCVSQPAGYHRQSGPAMGPKSSLEAPQRSPASERQSGDAAECGQNLDDPRSHGRSPPRPGLPALDGPCRCHARSSSRPPVPVRTRKPT